MKVLDLFAGLGGWSAPFAARGHDVYRVDLDPRFDVESHADILTLTAADLPWRPDIILASPPCEGFTVLRIGRNWNHRSWVCSARRGTEAGPQFFVIENPRAMLRKLPELADLDRQTVTYCQYGHPSMKPTDLWGGFPPLWSARPMCRPKSPCHIAAPRGSRTGIQSDSRSRKDPRWEAFAKSHGYEVTDPAVRAVIPYELAHDMCVAAEWELEMGRRYVPTTLWEAIA